MEMQVHAEPRHLLRIARLVAASASSASCP
jgi:hypothetical protein